MKLIPPPLVVFPLDIFSTLLNMHKSDGAISICKPSYLDSIKEESCVSSLLIFYSLSCDELESFRAFKKASMPSPYWLIICTGFNFEHESAPQKSHK